MFDDLLDCAIHPLAFLIIMLIIINIIIILIIMIIIIMIMIIDIIEPSLPIRNLLALFFCILSSWKLNCNLIVWKDVNQVCIVCIILFLSM